MRILKVLPAFYPALEFGGPIPVARETAHHLMGRGHEVTVWTTNLAGWKTKLGNKTEEREIDGMRTVYMNSVLRYHWVGIAPDVFRYLRRELKGYDLVHIYGYREFLAMAVARGAKRDGKPYVLQALGTTTRMKRSFGKKFLYDTVFGEGILKHAASLIAKSPAEFQQYLDVGLPEDRISYIPNGIEIPEEARSAKRGKFRAAYGFDAEDLLFLFLGRIDPIKGLDLLTEAFAALGARARLAIVGPDEGYRAVLESQVARRGLKDRVVFTGSLYGEEKWEAYLDADIYVLPSLYENFPRTVLEAMSCETAVILTDRCGIAPQIENRAGLVVPYEKVALIQAMKRLANDQSLRQRLAESGRRLLAEEFSWGSLIDRLENLYESVA